MKRLAPIALLALALTACGGSDEPGEAAPTSPATTTETPSETPTPAEPTSTEPAVVTVSLSTTCELLFDDGDPALIDRILELVPSPTIGNKEYRQAKKLSGELEFVESSAKPSIQPFIGATLDEVDKIVSLAEGTAGSATRDLQNFRAAGIELIQRCTPYIG